MWETSHRRLQTSCPCLLDSCLDTLSKGRAEGEGKAALRTYRPSSVVAAALVHSKPPATTAGGVMSQHLPCARCLSCSSPSIALVSTGAG